MPPGADVARTVPVAPAPRDVAAFLALVSSLSARLAGAQGATVGQTVDACLRELLDFFGVEQCGIMEIQADRRQARLRHRVHLDGVQPAPTTMEYGALFPWTHARNVLRGEGFVQTCIDDLPVDATVDRASSVAIGVESIISVPVGPAGQTTHVLCLTSSRPMPRWPEAILAQLRLVAETFTAVLLRHKTEQALQISEWTLAEAQRIAGVGSYVRDWRDGTLLGSDEAHRIFGGKLGDGNRDLLDFVAPEDRTRVEEARNDALTRRTPVVELEYRIRRPDGGVRTILSRVETTYAPDGTPLRTLGTLRDVSALRDAEEESRRLRAELRHADRAAHAGALTASLSHELNQPLTGILANAQAGLRLLGPNAPGDLRDILEAIVRDDKRAAAVVDNVRTLLRREEPQRSVFDLGDACAEVLVLFKGELDANRVLVKCDLLPGCTLRAVRTQIQQVILNLLANGLQALRERRDGERRLELRLARIGRDRAEIRLSDNGVGIPAEYRDRIFDPFFTTRSEGLGMGLAICRSIVAAHGGDISAQSDPEGGVTFRFSLPVERFARPGREPVQRRSDNDPAVAPRESGIVCIVDDDVASRDGVARLLAVEGFASVAFESAEDALASPELASAHCLILDVQMPGMSGPDLHAEIVRRGIAAPIVFLSARSDAPTGVDAMKRGALEYLAKPVDEAVLLDAVRRAIERHAQLSRLAQERQSIDKRLARLTAREMDVLRHVIAGRLNKQIAADLSISEATVKQHRGQVMDKMQVRSVADLVRVCELARVSSAA